MNALQVEAPHYVLLDQAQRIGPTLLDIQTGDECLAIYGFSDKKRYDAFCEKSTSALTPYPLVNDYLRSQLESSDAKELIVVVDATGPHEQLLNGATIPSILEARENRASQVNVAFQLSKDDSLQAYRVAPFPERAPQS